MVPSLSPLPCNIPFFSTGLFLGPPPAGFLSPSWIAGVPFFLGGGLIPLIELPFFFGSFLIGLIFHNYLGVNADTLADRTDPSVWSFSLGIGLSQFFYEPLTVCFETRDEPEKFQSFPKSSWDFSPLPFRFCGCFSRFPRLHEFLSLFHIRDEIARVRGAPIRRFSLPCLFPIQLSCPFRG